MKVPQPSLKLLASLVALSLLALLFSQSWWQYTHPPGEFAILFDGDKITSMRVLYHGPDENGRWLTNEWIEVPPEHVEAIVAGMQPWRKATRLYSCTIIADVEVDSTEGRPVGFYTSTCEDQVNFHFNHRGGTFIGGDEEAFRAAILAAQRAALAQRKRPRDARLDVFSETDKVRRMTVEYATRTGDVRFEIAPEYHHRVLSALSPMRANREESNCEVIGTLDVELRDGEPLQIFMHTEGDKIGFRTSQDVLVGGNRHVLVEILNEAHVAATGEDKPHYQTRSKTP